MPPPVCANPPDALIVPPIEKTPLLIIEVVPPLLLERELVWVMAVPAIDIPAPVVVIGELNVVVPELPF